MSKSLLKYILPPLIVFVLLLSLAVWAMRLERQKYVYLQSLAIIQNYIRALDMPLYVQYSNGKVLQMKAK
ncbi:MAG: hypothetical protein SPL05_06125 [Eubacteriales bacterium]|nr:hypothetical protein [Eubacteriales bacterium]